MTLGHHQSIINQEIGRTKWICGSRLQYVQRLAQHRRKFRIKARVNDDTWLAYSNCLARTGALSKSVLVLSLFVEPGSGINASSNMCSRKKQPVGKCNFVQASFGGCIWDGVRIFIWRGRGKVSAIRLLRLALLWCLCPWRAHSRCTIPGYFLSRYFDEDIS